MITRARVTVNAKLCNYRARSLAGRRSASSDAYKSTLKNLKIGAHTRVMYQGFTGKQATANAIQNLEWGTKVVGGVTPGKSGEHLGLPLLPDMKEAARVLKPDATAVFVPAQFAAKAIEDAIEAEIPLVVAVAEHVPVHDMLRIHSMLNTQSKTRLVGANCPGIISPPGHCRIGFLPHTVFSAGSIGIVGKSGTLSYEAVASTTRAGLGQSLVIGMGGDWVSGTTLVDGMQVFLEDPATEGIIVIGEVGGRAELDVVELLNSWKGPKKPVMGLMAGTTAPKIKVMGHAGAVMGFSDPPTDSKTAALKRAGVHMVTHPGQFGERMSKLLKRSANPPTTQKINPRNRKYHTLRRPTLLSTVIQSCILCQKRTKHYPSFQEFFLFEKDLTEGITSPFHLVDISGTKVAAVIDPEVVTASQERNFKITVGVSVDRSTGSPCVVASNPAKPHKVISIPFTYPVSSNEESLSASFSSAAATLSTQLNFPSGHLERLIYIAWRVFKKYEAYSVVFKKITLKEDGIVRFPTRASYFRFDTAAIKAGKVTVPKWIPQRMVTREPEEIEAEKYGIVFLKLAGRGDIGCLVNGAGLAMNTNDALIHYGGSPANFLDTGGKATSETVKEGFRLILKDPRVKVVLVNIFGGLTLGDMIADGIILAFKELGITIPVVVRIRGTNEKLGQQKISESGLPLFAFDDLEDAAAKAIKLARRSTTSTST